MKKIIIIASFLFLTIGMQAQKKWTLQECVSYAIENNIEIKQQELQVENSEINLSTSKNSRLPDLNAQMGHDFNFGRSVLQADNRPVKKTMSGTGIGISSSMPLFTGFKIPNEIKANKLELLAAMEGLKKAKDNLELQVTSLYLDVLFKKEILKVNQKQVEQTEEQVTRTQLLVEGGKVPLAQLYDIKAQLAKDELVVTNANNDLVLTTLSLSQALNLLESEVFDIIEPTSQNNMNQALLSLLSPADIYEQAIAVKPHIKEAEYNVESQKKRLKMVQAAYMPTLDLNMSFSSRYDRIYGGGVSNTSFFKQMRDNSGEMIGVTLRIPIFNRFSVRNRVKGARLQIQNKELDLKSVQLTFFKEIQQAYQSAIAAQARFGSTEKAVVAAQESFKYMDEKYAVGKATVFEYNEAKFKLLTSQSEQIQSKYDFLFRTKILDFYRGIPISID